MCAANGNDNGQLTSPWGTRSGRETARMAEQLLSRGFQLRGWPWWARYGASAILVIIALELHLLLASTLAAYPFILFFPAVMIAALVFDRGAASSRLR